MDDEALFQGSLAVNSARARRRLSPWCRELEERVGDYEELHVEDRRDRERERDRQLALLKELPGLCLCYVLSVKTRLLRSRLFHVWWI